MLNDSGIIFRGVEKHIRAQGWNYGQVSRGTAIGMGPGVWEKPAQEPICLLLSRRAKWGQILEHVNQRSISMRQMWLKSKSFGGLHCALWGVIGGY